MATTYAIGVDLGGTNVRAALITADGVIIQQASDQTAATAGPEIVLQQICTLVRTVSAKVAPTAINGVGLCSPGPLDAKAGMVLNAPNLRGFVNLAIAELLEKDLPWSVVIENDGIAAAIGEWRFGVGKGHDNLVYVTVSTGIGGGVIADGNVLRGRKGMASHIGHMVIDHGAEDLCSCGNKGCWEALASGPAFTQRAQKRAATTPASSLAEIVDLEAHDVFTAAQEGDELAIDLIHYEAMLLAVGIVNVMHLYSPDVVILGGGMANDFALFKPLLDKHIQRWAMPSFRGVQLVQAGLQGNAGLLGAASLVFDPI